MKKSLVTFAVLTITGAASAQVAITGTIASGYRAGSYLTVNSSGLRINDPRAGGTLVSTMVGGGVTAQDSSGLGMDTAEIYFGFTEDIGGGTKIAGKMGIVGMDRGNSNAAALWSGATPPTAGLSGGDSSITLSGRMGALTLQSAYNPDYVSGGVGGTAQVGGVDMSGKVTLSRAVREAVAYTVPIMPGMVVQLVQAEANLLPGLAYPNSLGGTPGLGAGASGSATSVNQRQSGVVLNYVRGPLVLNVQYISADNRYDNKDTSIASVYRLGGNYNFGMAKVGVAIEADNTMTGQLMQTNVAVAVPLGALKLSANYAVAQTTDLRTTAALALQNGQRSGYGLAAEYALSKSTRVLGTYASWEQTVGAVARNSETNLILAYSF